MNKITNTRIDCRLIMTPPSVFWNSSRLIYDYIQVEALKTREISINDNVLQEPGIGPKLVLSEACHEHGRMGRMDPKQIRMTEMQVFETKIP